ncbi:MAG: acetylornithine/succinylornithine family transaminase [Alphaproteobacteria bacterium]|nr:acetylornithine/succinylornithine family transaminase [Alphaproteobacteria bacterium]
MTFDTTENYVARATDKIMPLYSIKNAILERGQNCHVWDTEGRQYLDCIAGIAVMSVGHCNERIINAIKDQIEKLTMCSGSYQTVPKIECAELLINASCMDQIFFTNSGAEAVEGSLKLARKWAHLNKGENCKEIIAFKNSFHGRTYGAVTCTYKSVKQPEFAPYLPGVHHAEFNNLESVKSFINDRTCAIIVEPVQGEGGILPATPEFMKGLRSLCDEHNIILISDEIQAGMGRLGTLFAYETYGVEPDIMAIAKGMGGGFPVGAFMAKKKYSEVFKYGDHGSTYAGNPLMTRIAYEVIDQIRRPDFLKNVVETGNYLMEGLQKLKTETNSIEDIRGKGLMIGIDTVYDINKVLKALQDNGLLATQAGAKSVRLTPPLTMGKAEADEALEKIGHVIRKGVM